MAFRVGGDYFRPADGRYLAQFLGVKDGPPQTGINQNTNEPETRQTMLWMFGLYNVDQTPVVDPKKPGTVAEGQGMSGNSVGVGRGVPAKGRRWLMKLLEAAGNQWVEPTSGEQVEAMVASCTGTFVYVTYAGGKFAEIEVPQQAIAAAPVAAPVAVAPPPPPVAVPPAPVAPPEPVAVAAPALSPFPPAMPIPGQGA